jgi:hypothetical protein
VLCGGKQPRSAVFGLEHPVVVAFEDMPKCSTPPGVVIDYQYSGGLAHCSTRKYGLSTQSVTDPST